MSKINRWITKHEKRREQYLKKRKKIISEQNKKQQEMKQIREKIQNN
jgi:hypothetical protein